MAESAEHTFLKTELGDVMQAFAGTGLLGVTEADRGRYDYACRLERDFVRAMDVQVCWGNGAALSKDLRHLLVASEAPVRLLVVRDDLKLRRQLDEVLGDYRRSHSSRLAGFRFLELPDTFDADAQSERDWMAVHLKQRLCSDLLFGAVFGRLSARDVRAFVNHGGPFGMKCATLAMCARTPVDSMRSLMAALGTKSNSSLREVLVMLTSTGLLHQMPRAQPWLPTLKGRFLLDLLARLLFEAGTRSEWSAELKLILGHLAIPAAAFWSIEQIRDQVSSKQLLADDLLTDLLSSALWARSFGVDLGQGLDPNHPVFRSELDWGKFEQLVPGQPFTESELMELY